MYISLNWLKNFVKIPAKIKPTTIAEELSTHTVEVENLIKQSAQFDKIVVGQVLELEKHPNADRLHLVVVDVKDTKLKIVCGANNLKLGQKVPVSLIGAHLPTGLEIQESIIRGEKSQGMICAEDELGLGRDHQGILVLNDRARVGETFAHYLEANDIILEIDNKSLSNRPDLLNHYGLAREISAIFDLPLKTYDDFLKLDEGVLSSASNKLAVKIEASDLCLRYSAIKIDNIEIKESPDWLKNSLIAVNQRPVNNIVDLTNYVMLECGQPLHAFDAQKIKKIIVRRAHHQETIKTLDDQERVLTNKDLVISSDLAPLAIAGLIGGQDSEITNTTQTIILEAANFLASNIRQTSQRLGLRTEASVRFEKSLDPELTLIALKRFLTLLKKVSPQVKIASTLFDYYPQPPQAINIDLDLQWLQDKIGQEIPRKTVINNLQRLGFIINSEQENILKVTVPSWRATKDVHIPEDLVEEVLRLYGYGQIKSQLPVLELKLPEINQKRLLERKIKNILVWSSALNEAYNYSFVGETQLKKLKIDFSQYLKLVNPLSSIHNLLRQSLVPGLINNIKINQFQETNFGFFELESVFFRAPGNQLKNLESTATLPYQEKHLGIILTGTDDLFFRLKGIVDNLLKNIMTPQTNCEFLPATNIPNWAQKDLAVKIVVRGKEIGLLALVLPEINKNFNLKKPVAIAEINFDLLAQLVFSLPGSDYRGIPKYPAVRRDISFVVNSEILYNDLRGEIIDFHPLLVNVELFDVYQGDKLELGKKSLAFHLSYQSSDRTLRAVEVDQVQKNLIQHLNQKFSIKLRDF